jgi:hypothetical protein
VTLPHIESERPTPRIHRPVVTAAVIGGGVCLLAVIVGLVVLGFKANVSESQGVCATGLAAIGATLAGGFAAWIGQGRANDVAQDERERDERRARQ